MILCLTITCLQSYTYVSNCAKKNTHFASYVCFIVFLQITSQISQDFTAEVEFEGTRYEIDGGTMVQNTSSMLVPINMAPAYIPNNLTNPTPHHVK